MTPLYVADLWRYPVKTLAGERLPAATLTADGVQGDRLVQVYGPEGVRTSRRHHRLLGLRGTLGPLGDNTPQTTPPSRFSTFALADPSVLHLSPRSRPRGVAHAPVSLSADRRSLVAVGVIVGVANERRSDV